MIDVKNLYFEYSGKTILHDISFHIPKNSVVALVGPNGAGKTTLMRSLIALERPVSGEIFINGIDALENPRAVHRCSGYLSDFFGLYENLSVEKCLIYMARCQTILEKDILDRVHFTAQETGLTEYLKKSAGILSRGYRQRLGVALAIIHNPKILLLDEPASGMDPEARIKFSELILSLKARGMTIMVSSHILAELEDYCTEMLILRDGRICDHISTAAAQSKDQQMVTVKCLEMNERILSFFKSYQGVLNVLAHENIIEITVQGREENLYALLKDAVAQNIPIFSFEAAKATMQKAYMDFAQRQNDNVAKETGA